MMWVKQLAGRDLAALLSVGCQAQAERQEFVHLRGAGVRAAAAESRTPRCR